ncbi:hypothetical protein [Anaeromyxobacter sp. Fw109-5]|uniref:hypothetical protein n=1 Tax=Anaeromyxobacter sp. (strain Fw109-5) TaxID=404589 RepID=UPI0000ED6E9C|nr:hypothetical protein [Anaeromyxobacter sp. Fw109-5]ABS28138.1 conserved hypothetical protein [Anaeromyxobacter sp. Fw109-5]
MAVTRAARSARPASEDAPGTSRSTTALALVVFVLSWLLLVFAGGSKLLQDPGTLWHTVTGHRIFAAGFPRGDWLSFTFDGRPWIAHQWLAECLMAALHRLGGLDALVVATAGGIALLLAWLYARLVAAGVSALWAGLVVALTVAASSHHFHVRPHLLSIFAFAWLYGRLADVDAGRRGLSALWPAPLVFLAWVNAHGAVVGGLATLGLFALSWLGAWRAGWTSPVRSRRDAAVVYALVAASVATVPITPYGLDTARAWFAILSSPALPRFVVEHASLVRTGSWQVLALVAVYLATLLSAPRVALRAATLVPLVWLLLAFGRIRHAPFFAVAAALALAELLPAARWTEALARRGFRVRGAPGTLPGVRFAAGTIGALAIALVAVATFAAYAPDRAPALARLDPRRWPVELVPALRAAEREVEGAPILNDMPFGGFVAYTAPGLRVFVDDRWELYGDDFMLGYIRADPAWLDAWIDRFGVRVALVQHGSRLERHLERDGTWRLAATSAAGSLYRRPGNEVGSASPTLVPTRGARPETPAARR